MSPDRIARIEGIVQVLILLFMGIMAGAASFVHIHDVTVQYGQPSWIGWANAIVIELMSIVAGLDIRRRKRSRQPTGFVLAVLLTAIGVSLAAQVAEAHPSVWGWTVAAVPALGLLAVVKIVLSRTTPTTPDRTTTASGSAGPPDQTYDGKTIGRDETVLGRPRTTATAPSDRAAGHPPQTSQSDPTAAPAQPSPGPDRSRIETRSGPRTPDLVQAGPGPLHQTGSTTSSTSATPSPPTSAANNSHSPGQR